MKLNKLFPLFKHLDLVQGIEREILKHKNRSTIGFIMMMIFGLYQVVVLVVDQSFLQEIITQPFSLYRFRWVLGFAFGFIAYVLFKRTGFLLKEAKEPFQYTFWIEPFKRASDEPDKAFEIESEDTFHEKDRMLQNLLHHDLKERLKERIKRLSLLDVNSLKIDTSKVSSHIQVEGYYTFRIPRQESGCIILQVIPQVRIGPTHMPVTLANPVNFRIPKKEGTFTLEAENYDQIVERVYSSIATEIYRQIDSDLEKKLALFPTNFTRANALYYEAKDFSRSNTLDAFERAIALYEKARRYYNISFNKILVEFFVSFPLLLWRFKVRSAHLYASIQVGWAQCLISRRIISSCSGRRINPIFEVLKELNQVIMILMKLYNRINPKWKLDMKGESPGLLKTEGYESYEEIEEEADEQNEEQKAEKNPLIRARKNAVMSYLAFPRDSYWRKFFLRPLEELYEKQYRILFETFSVCALTYYLLNAYKRAEVYIENAKAIAPSLTQENPLYIFTRGVVEAKIDKEIVMFRNAVDLAPKFQVVQFYLAHWSEMQFRMNDDLSFARAKSVQDEYEKVLKINPGNIAALAAQGYIYWLLGCEDNRYLVEAKRKFQEGCEIKAINRETYIGELNYGLARIAAEEGRFEESCDYYNQAISADPGVGAYSPPEIGKTQSRYYEYISPKMLQRFECFKKVFENKVKKNLKEKLLFQEKDLKDLPGLVEKIKNGQHPFYLHVKGLFSKEMQKALEKHDPSLPDSKELELRIINEINRLIQIKKFDEKEADIKVNKKNAGILTIKEILGDQFSELDSIVFNRSLLETKFPEEILGRTGSLLEMLACLYSYILNDYGNACLNFFHRFGDRCQLNHAVKTFKKAIELNDKNLIAYYNLHNALKWRDIRTDTHEEILKCLDKADELIFTWPEILVAAADYRLENQRESIRETLKHKKKKDRTGQKNKKKKSKKALTKTPEEEAKEIVSILNEEIEKIVSKTKLSPLVKSFGLDLSKETIDRYLKKNIQVNRLDENDVQALKIWTKYLSVYVPHKEEIFQAAEKLSSYILENYYPDDFEMNQSLLKMYEEKKRYLEMEWYSESEDAKREAVKTYLDYRYKQDPLNYNVFYLASKVYEIEDFTTLFKQVSFSYNNPAYQHILGSAHHDKGNFEEAEKYYKNAHMAAPQEVRYIADLGNLYYDKNKFLEAKKTYLTVCKLDPQNPEIHTKLFLTYLELGEDEEAEKVFQAMFEANRSNPGYLYELGKAFQERAFYEEVIDEEAVYEKAAILYERAIKLDPKKAQYYAELGNTYCELQNWDSAKDAYEKAIEFCRPGDGNGDYYFWLGRIYKEKEDYKKAADAFTKAIAADPENPTYLQGLGQTYSYGQANKSIEFYKQAIKLDSDEASIYADLGDAYYTLKKWGDAKKAYLNAWKLDPKNPDYLYKLGDIFKESGKLVTAAEYLLKAIAIAPVREYVDSLISACNQLKSRDKARNFLWQALAFDPGNSPLEKALRELN